MSISEDITRATFVYALGFTTIIFSFLLAQTRPKRDEGEAFSWFTALGLVVPFVCMLSYAYVTLVISSSLENTRLVIAMFLVVTTFALVALVSKKYDYAIRFSSVLLFLAFLPPVLDWFTLPYSVNLGGPLVQQIVESTIAILLGLLLDRLLRENKYPTKSGQS